MWDVQKAIKFIYHKVFRFFLSRLHTFYTHFLLTNSAFFPPFMTVILNIDVHDIQIMFIINTRLPFLTVKCILSQISPWALLISFVYWNKMPFLFDSWKQWQIRCMLILSFSYWPNCPKLAVQLYNYERFQILHTLFCTSWC